MSDPDYVKFIVYYKRDLNGEKETIYMDFHKCTDEDYDAFYEPNIHSRKAIESARKKKNLFCIDDFDKVKLFGNENEPDFGRFEFIIVPCNFGLEKG